ncbi:MAG: hypothetical protein ACJAUD_002909 [Crocinitomicaceae bacterium]|jgi:hypothetical protein
MKFLFAILSLSLLIGCSGEEDPKMELLKKEYWGPEDYDVVLDEIEYNTPEGEEFPRFDNSENAAVIEKLLDTRNFEVILNDDALGLNHKNEVAEMFFNLSQEMQELYSVVDRQDKFIYSQEFAKSLVFGLKIQLTYFKLGNQRIRERADDATSSRVINTMRSNETTCASNFALYLDYVNKQKAFDNTGLETFIAGINSEVPKMIEAFPEADFSELRQKAELMKKKSQNPKLQEALESIISQLDALTPEEEIEEEVEM